jgi:hypothetical protein
MTSIPTDLSVLYKSGRLIPFVGAGVSQSVTWGTDAERKRGVSWAELVDYAARDLEFDPDLLRARGSDLQILEYVIDKKGGPGFLSNWLATLSPPDAALNASPIHTALASLDRCPLLYTTNFDNFLERAFRLHGRSARVIANEKDLADQSRDVDIVKYHGDLTLPETMVLSESNYERRLRLIDPMDHKLQSDLLARAVLFIGYSFRDWNVAYLLRLFNDHRGQLPESNTGKRGYIFVADPSDFEKRLFRKRNIEVIGISSLNMTGDTAAFLEGLGGA